MTSQYFYLSSSYDLCTSKLTDFSHYLIGPFYIALTKKNSTVPLSPDTGMEALVQTPLSDALAEVQGILKIREKAGSMETVRVAFGPSWMDDTLHTKIRKLEDCSTDCSMVQGLDNLSRLLDVQRYLSNKSQTALVNQLTLIIIRQKSALESNVNTSDVSII